MKIKALDEVEKNEVHMEGAVGDWKQLPLGNEAGVPVYSYRVFTEQPIKAGDFALVNPDENHQYRNKGDKPFKMICGVPKEFE